MSSYTTRTITPKEAFEKIEAYMAWEKPGPILATNQQIEHCLDLVRDYTDPVDDNYNRRGKVDIVRRVLKDGCLHRLPHPHEENRLFSILGDMVDIFYREDTLNNFIVTSTG
jgi:hypothetical protein